MGVFFDPDSKFVAAIYRFTDLAMLNVVFLLTCIPIFTIGAANTALYDTVFRMETGREGPLFRTYFRAFRQNFKQSTWIWLLFCLLSFATWFHMTHFVALTPVPGMILQVVFTLVSVIMLMVFSYAFPLLSQFDNSIAATLRNALLLSIAHLPRSAVVLVVNCFPWVLMFVNFYTFFRISILWLFLYFSAAAYFNCHILEHVFKPYRQPQE